MRIHFTTEGKTDLKGTLVVKQNLFDWLQEQGMLEQRGLLFWYIASNEANMRTVMNSIVKSQLRNT